MSATMSGHALTYARMFWEATNVDVTSATRWKATHTSVVLPVRCVTSTSPLSSFATILLQIWRVNEFGKLRKMGLVQCCEMYTIYSVCPCTL